MDLKDKHALITGSSRGIGRGIALKLAESGVRIAVHYYHNETAANDTLAKVRSAGSEGCVVQGDVSRPADIGRMFDQVRAQFGGLDIFVSNARPELPAFYQAPMEIALDHWDNALDSQATAFLLGAGQQPSSCPRGAESWPSPTLPAVAPAACNRGSPWAPPRRRWSRWSAISLWPWPNDKSP